MPFFGVVSLGGVIEFFPTSEEAEAFVAEVAADEPELAATLSVEPIELEAGGSSN